MPKNDQTRRLKMDFTMKRQISANVKSKNIELFKLQVLNLYAEGPQAYILEECCKDNPTIGLSDVEKMVKSALHLVGNAFCHTSRISS